MRCYITGMAGFLGANLAEYLVKDGHTVTGCDDLSSGDVTNLDGVDAELKVYDITGLRAFDNLRYHMGGCDVVYHCAAAAYEGVSVFSPALISENIYAGSAAVFSAAISAGIKSIVYCSSMARYGDGSIPASEIDTCRPVDPYGLAKFAAEKLLEMLSQIHGIDYVIAVPHNIYGPKQKYDDPYRNVAAIMINRVLQGKPPLIFGDGQQVRCFSYIDDVVPCLARLGLDDHLQGRIFNLGPDEGEVTINQLADLICELTGSELAPAYMPGRPCDVKNATCSADRARHILGYETKTQLRDGLTKLIAYIKAKGPREFRYRIPLEIINDQTPRSWLNKLI